MRYSTVRPVRVQNWIRLELVRPTDLRRPERLFAVCLRRLPRHRLKTEVALLVQSFLERDLEQQVCPMDRQ